MLFGFPFPSFFMGGEKLVLENVMLSNLSFIASSKQLLGDYAGADQCYREAVHIRPQNTFFRQRMMENWAKMNHHQPKTA